ncbi:hypothetical protein GOP47_0021329 [Adiantum capillus-veneris]|uniref:Amine oxidase domain-containing protein n=1 Tax=Adiantum capillus-veneris TaxID=13818 RepID=A0A9D4Z7S0_ADICA|nr:hypothetical protein GOP47_0021329 [Adiantum capillus-veneris]
MPATPRVVVVGSGMAGLAAAHRLNQVCRHALDLTILEGSNRLGGRIQTASLGGDQVELGATLIHGINGSPIYDIAKRIGALSVDTAHENYENRFENPIFCAEGTRLPVDPRLLYPAIDLLRSSMALVKGKVAGQSLSHNGGSVGAFLRQRLHTLLLEQAFMAEDRQSVQDVASKRRELSTEHGENMASLCENVCDSPGQRREADISNVQRSTMRNIHTQGEDLTAQSQEDEGSTWTLRGSGEKEGETCDLWNPLLLQESVFFALEALERSVTACNSLDDLDLVSFKEYTEFPGPHVTIGKGYVSVLKELRAICLLVR